MILPIFIGCILFVLMLTLDLTRALIGGFVLAVTLLTVAQHTGDRIEASIRKREQPSEPPPPLRPFRPGLIGLPRNFKPTDSE